MKTTIEKPNGHTIVGNYEKKLIRAKDGLHVLNLTSQGDNKAVIRLISFLFEPIKSVGTVKSAGKGKFAWIPGRASKEENPIARIVDLQTLVKRLNEAQSVYNFSLREGIILRVKELNREKV